MDENQGMPALRPLDDIANSNIGHVCIAAVLVNKVHFLRQDFMHAVCVGCAPDNKQAASLQQHLHMQFNNISLCSKHATYTKAGRESVATCPLGTHRAIVISEVFLSFLRWSAVWIGTLAADHLKKDRKTQI